MSNNKTKGSVCLSFLGDSDHMLLVWSTSDPTGLNVEPEQNLNEFHLLCVDEAKADVWIRTVLCHGGQKVQHKPLNSSHCCLQTEM